MVQLLNRRPMLRVLWTLLTLASSLSVLGMVLGAAAWNGVNLAVCLYLCFSVAGVLGLLAEFFGAFSQMRLLAWITCAGAAMIAGMSVLLAYDFLFSRDPQVPLNSPFFIGSFHEPIIVLYGAALVFSTTEALFYFPKTRKLQGSTGLGKLFKP